MFDRSLDRLNRWLEGFIGVLMIALTAVSFMQVVLRYVFNNPTSWSSELCRFLLIWITLTGDSVVTRHASHLTMGLGLHRFIKARAARYLTAGMSLCIGGAMILIAYYSCKITLITGAAVSPGLGVPMYLPWAALPVNAVFICLFLAGDIVKCFDGKKG